MTSKGVEAFVLQPGVDRLPEGGHQQQKQARLGPTPGPIDINPAASKQDDFIFDFKREVINFSYQAISSLPRDPLQCPGRTIIILFSVEIFAKKQSRRGAKHKSISIINQNQSRD